MLFAYFNNIIIGYSCKVTLRKVDNKVKTRSNYQV
jgi:hypothetical protein